MKFLWISSGVPSLWWKQHCKTSLITIKLNFFWSTRFHFVFFHHLGFETFWQFLNKNICSDWLHYFCTRDAQAPVVDPCEHIYVRHHFICDYAEDEKVKIKFSRLESNVADLFTNNLRTGPFYLIMIRKKLESDFM